MIAGYEASTFDVEVFPNLSLIGIRDTSTGEVRHFSNVDGIGETFDAFREWFAAERQERLWIGFNSTGYDNWIVRTVLDGCDDPADIFTLSAATISAGRDPRNRLDTAAGEIGVDIYSIFAGRIGSLKELACKIGYPRLRALPYPFDAVLTFEQMQDVARYNIGDLEITAQVAKIVEDAIAARIALSIEFNVRLLNKHDAGLAEALMAHKLFGSGKRMWPNSTTWHLDGRDLVARFTYAHPALQELRDRMCQWVMRFDLVTDVEDGETVKRIEGGKFSEAVKVGEVSYSIGVGGLHSQDAELVYEADELYRLLDLDVASFYPALILNNGLVPAHLPRHRFLATFDKLRQIRLEAKRDGYTALSDGLKIAINSVFGKTGSAYGWLTDPTALTRCTVTGQLTLLQFVDLIQIDGVEVLSANTDGLTIRVRREIADAVVEACNDLAGILKLSLDWADTG